MTSLIIGLPGPDESGFTSCLEGIVQAHSAFELPDRSPFGVELRKPAQVPGTDCGRLEGAMSASPPWSFAHGHPEYFDGGSQRKPESRDFASPQAVDRRVTHDDPPKIGGSELEICGNSITTALRDASVAGVSMRYGLFAGSHSVDRSIVTETIPRAPCHVHQAHLCQNSSNLLALTRHSSPGVPMTTTETAQLFSDFAIARCFNWHLVRELGVFSVWEFETLKCLPVHSGRVTDKPVPITARRQCFPSTPSSVALPGSKRRVPTTFVTATHEMFTCTARTSCGSSNRQPERFVCAVATPHVRPGLARVNLPDPMTSPGILPMNFNWVLTPDPWVSLASTGLARSFC